MELTKIYILIFYLIFLSGKVLLSKSIIPLSNEIVLVSLKANYKLIRHSELLNERISSEIFVDDTLCLSVSTNANCCKNFNAEIKLINDTINLVYEQDLINCECECDGECSYELIFKILGVDKNIKYKYKLNNRTIYFSEDRYTGIYLSYKDIDGWVEKIVPLDHKINTNLIYGSRAIDEYPRAIDGDTLEIVEYTNKKLKEILSKAKKNNIYRGYVRIKGVVDNDGTFTLINYDENMNKEITELVIKIFEQTLFEPAKINGTKVTLETLFPIRIFLN